ncbi:hypothetical protein B0H11DRAFT_1904294 [Mycena galericulata]|nr:hypothetical protein B0H11DRAFT_1904294 [Mycena galericulata]
MASKNWKGGFAESPKGGVVRYQENLELGSMYGGMVETVAADFWHKYNAKILLYKCAKVYRTDTEYLGQTSINQTNNRNLRVTALIRATMAISIAQSKVEYQNEDDATRTEIETTERKPGSFCLVIF